MLFSQEAFLSALGINENVLNDWLAFIQKWINNMKKCWMSTEEYPSEYKFKLTAIVSLIEVSFSWF